MMHSYSVDFNRSTILLAIGIIAVFVGGTVELILSQFTGMKTLAVPALTVAGIIYWVFDRWLWRYPPFIWLHSIPNLAGTWEGEIESSYGSDDEDGLTPIDPDGSRLIITQRWSSIEVNYRNPGSSRSRSISARIETDTAEPVLKYIYENDPEGDGLVSSQSPHRGTAVLTLHKDGEDELRGSYFNDQEGGQSYGEMRFEQIDD